MSLSTTQYGYIVDPMFPFTDDKGKTIKNGFIRVFMAGTSTPVLTYRNYDGATNQEKIELDNSGRVKYNVIGSKGSLYKVVVYNILHSQENPLLTVDKIAVLGASINATGATIVTGLDSVTVQEENFLKATVEGTGVELAFDPTEVTSEISTISDAVTAAPDYVVPLLEKTGTEDSKKISLANLFKFALDWISRLATTITSFANGDFIAVSNPTDGTRKMSKDTLLTLTAQNALAGNVAPAFDPTRTSENPYKAGESVVYEGKTYTFKVDHYEAWNASDVELENDLLSKSKRINLFDKSTVLNDRYLASGVPSYLAGYFASDFIPIVGGSVVKFDHCFIIAWYDASKTYISNGEGLYQIAPNNASYCRVSNKNEFLDTLQVGYNVSVDDYKGYNERQTQSFVDYSKILNVPKVERQDIIDFTDYEDGRYLNADGTKGSNSNFILTNYILLEGGYFSSKYLFNFAFYDAQKQLTRVVGGCPNAILANNEKFVRMTINKENLYRVQASNSIGVPTIMPEKGLAVSNLCGNSNGYESYDVNVGAGKAFASIKDTLDLITDASPKKRYRLILDEGTYEETFHTKNYVDIIGENRYKCIITYVSDDESDWVNRSTIFATSNTTLKNLTITTKGTKYPIHSDGNFGAEYHLVVENCTIKHLGFDTDPAPAGTGFGIGLYHGQHITIKNCDIESSGIMGASAVYCHNSNPSNATHAKFRSLELDGVKLNNSTYGLRIQAIETTLTWPQKNECVLKDLKSDSANPVKYEAITGDSWEIENYSDYNVT